VSTFPTSTRQPPMQGRVTHWNRERGFGFIKPDDGSRDVFLHISEVQRGGVHFIEIGDVLRFDLKEQSDRPAARNVRVPDFN